MSGELSAVELDAMPPGQIVLDCDGDEWRKNGSGWLYLKDEQGAEEYPAEYQAPALVTMWGPISQRGAHVEQPLPTASTGPSMHDLAVEELAARKAIGLVRYGQPLQAMNGRDAVRDTIEELADGLAYALQIREERRLLLEELVAFRDTYTVDRSRTALGDIIGRYFPEG